MVNAVLLSLLAVLSTVTWVLGAQTSRWSVLYLVLGFLFTHGLILLYIVIDRRAPAAVEADER